jgi:adenine deaminase
MSMIRLLLAAVVASSAMAGWMPAIAAELYDIVLSAGRVMDPESGLDAARNVGIRHGRIAGIAATPVAGRRVIAAAGRVVAPDRSIQRKSWSATSR